MNQEIINRLKTLKVDINTSPDYGASATKRGKTLVDGIMQTLRRVQGNTISRNSGGMMNMGSMMGGYSSNGVLNNIMGNSVYKKNRMSIIADIDMIKTKVNRDPNISGQVTSFVNRKLDMIKSMR